MKFNKRKIFVVALAVCLIAIISMGSLAWFSAEDSVTNNFYVADSDDNNPEDIFSVDVYEKYDSNGNGNPEEYQVGVSYKDVLPGDELEKKAYVVNTGYYDQYVRVIVTISDAAVWQSVLGNNFNDASLLACFEGFDQDKWTDISTEVVDGNIRVVMYYKGILDGSDTANDGSEEASTITVFEKVIIPSAMTQEHASHFDDDGIWGFTIGVKAQAVQTENVGNSAVEAFTTVNMAI